MEDGWQFEQVGGGLAKYKRDVHEPPGRIFFLFPFHHSVCSSCSRLQSSLHTNSLSCKQSKAPLQLISHTYSCIRLTFVAPQHHHLLCLHTEPRCLHKLLVIDIIVIMAYQQSYYQTTSLLHIYAIGRRSTVILAA